MSFAQNFMPRPVVSFSHVSKDYTLYSSFSDKLKGLFLNNSKIKTYRAVDDVNFILRQGEVVGLIGLKRQRKVDDSVHDYGHNSADRGQNQSQGRGQYARRVLGHAPRADGYRQYTL